MHKLAAILTVAAGLTLASQAQARGFKSDLSTTITGPINVEVVVSEDLAHRAENLPKKLSDRGSGRRLNAGFANNGLYGQKEIDRLVEEVNEELAHDFEKRGIAISENASTTLRVTLVMAKPNRPTHNQLSRDIGLSFNSFGLGGAELTADVIGANGESLGTMEYDYYTSFNERVFQPIGIWEDANRSISKFSRKASKTLAALGASGNR